ncbi:MAG: hypothetical protein ACI910_002806 [Oleispira sp.]|jgi:hypothetical protein
MAESTVNVFDIITHCRLWNERSSLSTSIYIKVCSALQQHHVETGSNIKTGQSRLAANGWFALAM